LAKKKKHVNTHCFLASQNTTYNGLTDYTNTYTHKNSHIYSPLASQVILAVFVLPYGLALFESAQWIR